MPTENLITHDFDRLIAQYPGFFDALVAYANEIRKYGSVKGAIEEAEKRLLVARAADNDFNVEMERRHAGILAELESKTDAAKARLATQEEAIVHRVMAAKLDAEKIVDAGQRQRDRILAEANVAAAAVGERVFKAQTQAAALEKEVAAKQENVSKLDASIAAKQAELDSIEAARAAIIAKISA